MGHGNIGHGRGLTRDEAEARARLLSDVRYHVEVDLTGPSSELFGSVAEVRFACAEPGASTFLDLGARSVEWMELNGRPLPPDAFAGGRVRLDGLAASNHVRIAATCAYERSAVGLHRFVDPVDGNVYVYNHFEPYAARVFACFDQPDLKAAFELAVRAPAGWQVLSNGAPVGAPEALPGGAAGWRFEPTRPIPTYIMVLVAGPWHGVTERHGEIDLGLWCRRSLAPYLDAEEFLEVTKQGFDFYQRTFAYPYPFGKYDQVMVPEMGGAMEQAGCVTFSEEFVFRSRVTDAAREVRANVILHELAHMWFGNLVTMRWWDDLWLNESFASFISVFAQVAATRFHGGWVTFAQTEKNWAYEQDQLPSTHPISAEVPDTDTVLTNFDGITYAKGAAVLRQLVAWVGEHAFVEGLRAYFRRHEYGNTDLRDFLAALEEASGRDLRPWSRAWLERAGVNTLEASLDVAGSGPGARIGGFTIHQRAPAEHQVLRPHRVSVGLYDRDGNGLALRKRLELDVTGASVPVPELAGLPVPDLALLNDTDLTYAKVRLDAGSLPALKDSLGGLRDPLARTIGWGVCWDMVRDAELPTGEYFGLVLRNVAEEPEVGVLQDVLAKLGHAVDLYGDPAARTARRVRLADVALAALDRATPGSDLQLAWARAFVAVAGSGEHLALLRGLLSGEATVEGLAVDTDLRWEVVRALAAAGAADEGLIAAELDRDPTDAGRRKAAAARAACPAAAAKAAAWEAVAGADAPSRPLLDALSEGFHQPGQEELLEPYAERFFASLDELRERRDLESMLAFTGRMFPRLLVGELVVAMTEAWLEAHPDAGPLRRRLVERTDAIHRALSARAADQAAG
ncbi:MAG TPA: aminopeptidase N [Actinomycetes bacterium]